MAPSPQPQQQADAPPLVERFELLVQEGRPCSRAASEAGGAGGAAAEGEAPVRGTVASRLDALFGPAEGFNGEGQSGAGGEDEDERETFDGPTPTQQALRRLAEGSTDEDGEDGEAPGPAAGAKRSRQGKEKAVSARVSAKKAKKAKQAVAEPDEDEDEDQDEGEAAKKAPGGSWNPRPSQNFHFRRNQQAGQRFYLTR